MKTFTITHKQFVAWYYEDGQDEENKELKMDLAEIVICADKNKTIQQVVEEIFNECNKDAIKVDYLEEFDMNKEEDALYQDCDLGAYALRNKIEKYEVILLFD